MAKKAAKRKPAGGSPQSSRQGPVSLAYRLQRASVHLRLLVRSIVSFGRAVADDWKYRDTFFRECISSAEIVEALLDDDLTFHFAAAYLELAKAAQYVGRPPAYWGWRPNHLSPPSNHLAAWHWSYSHVEHLCWIIDSDFRGAEPYKNAQLKDYKWIVTQLELHRDRLLEWSTGVDDFPDDAIPMLATECMQAMLDCEHVSRIQPDRELLHEERKERRYPHTEKLEKLLESGEYVLESGKHDISKLCKDSGAPNEHAAEAFIRRWKKNQAKKQT